MTLATAHPAAVAAACPFVVLPGEVYGGEGEAKEGDKVFLAPGIDKMQGLRAGVQATVVYVAQNGNIRVREDATRWEQSWFKASQLARPVQGCPC